MFLAQRDVLEACDLPLHCLPWVGSPRKCLVPVLAGSYVLDKMLMDWLYLLKVRVFFDSPEALPDFVPKGFVKNLV